LSKLHAGFQVRQYKPWKLWFLLVVVAGLLVLAFVAGQTHQAFQLERVLLERETLVSRIAELENRNHRLVQENAQLEGGSKIEREAYQQANQELVRLQQELLAQREELVFYRGIVSPSDTTLGVNLQSFEVRKKNSQNLYSYKLILTKSGKSTKRVSGNTELLIRGESNGNVTELVLTDLVVENSSRATKFAFRYFQVFEGDIILPEGFEPFEVKIGVKPTTKNVKAFTETISWAEVLSEGV
jgi:cell division protein FtsB